MKIKTAVLGGGNMGGAIAKGLALAGEYEVTVTHPHEDLLNWNLANGSPIRIIMPEDRQPSDPSDNLEAIRDASFIVLAVKPYKIAGVIDGIRGSEGFKDKVIISVAAGVSCEVLQQMCENPQQAVFRIIPDTAIMLGESATFISCSSQCSQSARSRVSDIFSSMGKVYEVMEDQIPQLTAISSCGIAYVMRFITDLAEAGRKEGVDKHLSMDVTLQTVRGALAILERDGTDPEKEIKRVCTPGGITERGLKSMAENGFTQAIEEAVRESTKLD